MNNNGFNMRRMLIPKYCLRKVRQRKYRPRLKGRPRIKGGIHYVYYSKLDLNNLAKGTYPKFSAYKTTGKLKMGNFRLKLMLRQRKTRWQTN